MPNFSDVKTMAIPEGEVIKIASGSTVLWTKPSESYDYKGSASASYTTSLTLNNSDLADKLSSNSDINKNGIYLKGSSGGSDVITEIKNGVVYYGDGSGTIADGLVSVTLARHPSTGKVVGIGLVAGSDGGTDLYFDGNYTWGYNKN